MRIYWAHTRGHLNFHLIVCLRFVCRLSAGRRGHTNCLKPPFPEGAFYVVEGGPDDRVRVNWDLASDVDQAMADLCPTTAIEMYGKIMTAAEVLDEVERDASFYRTSGGGMTLSGGECQLQPDFAVALLEGAHGRGINTAIESLSQ